MHRKILWFGGAVAVGLLVLGLNRACAEDGELPRGMPDGLNGFMGIVQGTLTAKNERGFDVEVDKVIKTWERNRASRPEAAAGKKIHFRVNPEQKHIVESLRGVESGDVVVAGGAHRQGDALQAVEVLVKASEWPALQSKWEAAARERRERTTPAPESQERIRQLERQVEELRKQNAELRRKLDDR